MKFENLQAIWDTQNDKPVFAMKDARLLVALYQQREQSRRQLSRQAFAPLYVMALIGLAGVGLTFFAFLWKSLHIEKIARDFPMSAWDYAAFAVAAGALVAMVAPMYAEQKRHERTQEVFAPSLREELERGISQLDFELGLFSTPRVASIYGWLTIAVVLFNWELGRLNGNSTSWDTVWMPILGMVAAIWPALYAKKTISEGMIARRRALESMRAALDEDQSSLAAEIRKDT